MDEVRARYTQELLEASKRVREEPQPNGNTIYDHVFSETNVVASTEARHRAAYVSVEPRVHGARAGARQQFIRGVIPCAQPVLPGVPHLREQSVRARAEPTLVNPRHRGRGIIDRGSHYGGAEHVRENEAEYEFHVRVF
jgi:hypothetical protein